MRKPLRRILPLLLVFLAAASVRLFLPSPAALAQDAAPQAQGQAAAQAPRVTGPERWAKTMDDFEAKDKVNPPKPNSVLFTGSSSFVKWTTMESDLAPIPVLNRSFGGSVYADVDYWVQRNVINYKPAAVVVYAGDNDLAAPGKNTPPDAHRTTPEEVAQEVRQFVDSVHAKLPATTIYVVSIKPSWLRWDVWPDMKHANDLIQADIKKEKNVQYIDVATPSFMSQDKPPRDLFVEDGLHPTAKLYGMWTSIMKPILMKYAPKSSSMSQRPDRPDPRAAFGFMPAHS